MNVGDYVRTDIGEIRKVVRVTDDLYVLDKDVVFAHKDKIKKSSPNIIDLIEVGDYVNGCLIVEIMKDPFIKGQINLWTNMILSEGEPFPNEYFKEKIIEKDIKSILTKEQFESMEYKVGE